MSSSYRRIYPDSDTIVGLAKASTLMEIGDLLYDDGTNFLPAVQLADQGGDSANQVYFAARFVGVANDARLTSQTTTGNILAVASGTFEYPCAATDWGTGDYIAAAGNGSTTGLLSQQVAKTTDPAAAIGYSLQNTASGATIIQGRFVGKTARAFPITASITGAVTITSASATSLAVGRLGATTPALTVDSSTSSQVAGLKITGAATLGTVALVVTTDSGAANLTINAVSSGTIGIGTVSTGAITIGAAGKFVVTQTTGTLTLADSANVVLASTTGTKIGTATTQKLSFWNATPVVQPVANTDATTGAAGSTNTVYLNTTFTGSGGTAAYSLGGVITALKAIGLLAP